MEVLRRPSSHETGRLHGGPAASLQPQRRGRWEEVAIPQKLAAGSLAILGVNIETLLLVHDEDAGSVAE